MTQNNLDVSINKGSLIAFSGSLPQELTVGANGLVLTNDSGSSLGQAWSALPPLTLQTYTPVVFGSTVTGSASYDVQSGFFSTFGNVVCVYAQIDFNSFNGTGDFQVTIPITIGTSMANLPLGACQFTSAFTGSGDNILANGTLGNNFITFLVYGSGVSTTTQACEAAGSIRMSFIYLKD